ncbi:hypothetical protein Acr_00g0100360 [Actinidia rufa]|uniref:Retroviral polymerase SH3-like domain-containing protein n=1 Tax=Actinidia rufa TaxID=165716 RepID=A0A7J0DZV6_9ERIC|nr:hypothetical protein Acr_00g0100360 [Actinidia rufa]
MSKGYRCYDPVAGHMYHSLDVTFLETVPFFSRSLSSPGTTSKLVMEANSAPPCPLPILEPTPPSLSGSHALAPMPASSPDSGISSPLVFDIPPPRYPTRSYLWGLFNATQIIPASFVANLRVDASLSQFMWMISSSRETMLLGLFRLLGLPKVYLSLRGSILLIFFKIQACLGVDLHLRHGSKSKDISRVRRTVTRSIYLSVTCRSTYLFDEYKTGSYICDADYAGSKIDKRSTSGFCTFRGSHLISWKSKKQAVVSQSSAEAEYRAIAQGTSELLWLRSLLDELGFSVTDSSSLFCDNKSAVIL